jgi:hypothetical protein
MESINGHLIGFDADISMREHRVVELEELRDLKEKVL